MENRAYALITGLFVIAITAAMLVWAHWLAKEPLTRTPFRVVSSAPVSGLKPQAQVRYRGIDVGRVTAIALDPKDTRRILVDIEVDAAIPVTKGTYAQLGMEGITGIAYVHLLDEGKEKELPAKAADGVAELELRPSFFDTMSDSAEAAVRDARELMQRLNGLITPENRERLAATIKSMEKVTASLEVAAERLPSVIARADSRLNAWLAEDNRRLAVDALRNMNETAAALPALAKETQALMKESQQLVKDARELAARVGKLSDEAQGTAGGLREDTLPRVNALAETVERGAQRVGRLAADLEKRPESLIFGNGPVTPGPGEPGFK